jgi:hypothetical protein
VPERGVADGVAVEQDRRHQVKARDPVLTTSAAVAPPRRAVCTASSM